MSTINRDNVYLYSARSGRIEVHQGCVKPYLRGKARFTFKRYGKDAHLLCPIEPGIVHHGVVWLFENDIEKARILLIDRELEAIDELHEKIKKRERNIELLMGDAK